jgi:hypothetical protein
MSTDRISPNQYPYASVCPAHVLALISPNQYPYAWEPARVWNRWDAWRMGVIESRGDVGITWESDDHPRGLAMNDYYDEGRDYGRRALGLD